MLAATLVNLVIVFLAFVFKPGGSGVGWEFGAFLALIAAIVAAAPFAIPQLRARPWADRDGEPRRTDAVGRPSVPQSGDAARGLGRAPPEVGIQG